jgi:hypothetical protein
MNDELQAATRELAVAKQLISQLQSVETPRQLLEVIFIQTEVGKWTARAGVRGSLAFGERKLLQDRRADDAAVVFCAVLERISTIFFSCAINPTASGEIVWSLVLGKPAFWYDSTHLHTLSPFHLCPHSRLFSPSLSLPQSIPLSSAILHPQPEHAS